MGARVDRFRAIMAMLLLLAGCTSFRPGSDRSDDAATRMDVVRVDAGDAAVVDTAVADDVRDMALADAPPNVDAGDAATGDDTGPDEDTGPADDTGPGDDAGPADAGGDARPSDDAGPDAGSDVDARTPDMGPGTDAGDGGADTGPARCMDSACNDGVDCTLDVCVAGACVNSPIDGRCTAMLGGVCEPVTGCRYRACRYTGTDRCDAATDCATARCEGDVCVEDPVCADDCCDGRCVPEDCSDGNSCTNDSCDDGICERDPLCENVYPPCVVAMCAGGGCTLTPNDALCTAAPGGVCDTGLTGCRYPSVCNATTCPSNGCFASTCTGTSCRMTSLCGPGEECCAGTCVRRGCNDFNPCTTDSCGTSGCVNTPNTLPCGDGDFCNGAERCGGGSCGSSSGDPCPSGTACIESANSCAACGGVQQPCCTGGTCGTGTVCASSTCILCGGPGQRCCSSAMPCVTGTQCTTTTPTTCQPCGGIGQSCCAGTSCGSGLTCSGAMCVDS